jgi:type III secretory pathway component EscT
MMLGLTNRVAEQVQVFFLGMTVKGLVGLAVFMLTLGYTLDFVVTGSFERIAAFFGG